MVGFIDTGQLVESFRKIIDTSTSFTHHVFDIPGDTSDNKLNDDNGESLRFKNYFTWWFKLYIWYV